MSDEPGDNIVNEPQGFYGNRKITFYKSFEEENDATYTYYSGLTPVQCLQQLNQLVRQFYQTELKNKPTIGPRITFD